MLTFRYKIVQFGVVIGDLLEEDWYEFKAFFFQEYPLTPKYTKSYVGFFFLTIECSITANCCRLSHT